MEKVTKEGLKVESCILTPPVSHGGQKYTEGCEVVKNEYTINIDTLTFHTKGHVFQDSKKEGAEVFERGRFVFMLHHFTKGAKRWTGNFNYKYTYAIFEMGEGGSLSDRVGLLFTCIKEKRAILQHGQLSKIEVENHLLYQRGYSFQLSALVDSLNVDFNNFTRIDIAIDSSTTAFVSDFLAMHGNKKSFEKVGRARIDTIEQDGETTFYVGSRGGKRVRGYCKSAEMVQKLLSGKSDKSYIQKFWEQNGLGGSVDRLEIELHSKQIAEVKIKEGSVCLEDLEDTRVLAAIAKAHIRKFCQFAKVDEKQTNKSRWDKIDLVDWEALECIEIVRERKVSTVEVMQKAKRSISFDMQEMAANSGIAIRKRLDRLNEKESRLIERVEGLEAKNENIELSFKTSKKWDWIAANVARIAKTKEALEVIQKARVECAYYVELSDNSKQARKEVFDRCKARAARYGLYDWFQNSIERWESNYQLEIAILESIDKNKKGRLVRLKGTAFDSSKFVA